MSDDEDFEWEYAVKTSGPDVRTPWQVVKHDETRPQKCWADGFYEDGSSHTCFDDATTDLGLCDAHQRELIPHEDRG